MPRDTHSEGRSWLLQRRNTLNRRHLVLLFASLCAPTLLVALAFTWWGYWHMLAYALLEMAALAACLRHYARHARDYDRIDIAPGVIVIEQRRADRCSRRHLNPWSARLLPPGRDGDPIRLEHSGGQIALGKFLSPVQRRQLASELACFLPNDHR
jgi:uncharacterized membrane protein